ESEKAIPLLKGVDQFHIFDRGSYQESLADPSSPLLEAYDRFKKWVSKVQEEAYTYVINLSHTYFSYWVSSLIPAEIHLGAHETANGIPGFGSPWFRYLEEQVSRHIPYPHHFIDIFRWALDLDSQVDFAFQETASGKKETSSLSLRSDEKLIVIQPFTSDKKKNYHESLWLEVINKLIQQKERVILLGAPFEKEALLKLAHHFGSDLVRPFVCSMEGAYSLLKNHTRILITGDTSIKHLACGTSCKLIEISLGSSQFYLTGAYKEGSIILQTKASCAPCLHRQNCIKGEPDCSFSVTPEDVLEVIKHGEKASLSSCKGFLVTVKEFPFVHFKSFNFLKEEISALKQKLIWKFFLDGEWDQTVPPIGSLSYMMARYLNKRGQVRLDKESFSSGVGFSLDNTFSLKGSQTFSAMRKQKEIEVRQKTFSEIYKSFEKALQKQLEVFHEPS
ncbi:MAG: hypothetical protein D6797_06535, partial [Bdellovibrio sp.]